VIEAKSLLHEFTMPLLLYIKKSLKKIVKIVEENLCREERIGK